MRILCTFYSIQDYGGIINNHEGLVAGLKELGHEVSTRLLVWKDSIQTNKSTRRLLSEKDATGMSFDQQLGWVWPAHMRFAYKGKTNIRRWKEYASKFDLIIWQIPVPSKNRQNAGNRDWLELYDVPVKQIAYVHDGNMPDAYPWLSAVAHHLCGTAATHPCGYATLAKLPLPRALVFSAHQNIDERIAAARESKYRDGWLSLQTFKGWKHVDDIVRAVPYMKDYPKTMAGGGIHYFYMTSKDKIKPEYLASLERDPDLDTRFAGIPIWQLALRGGMDYLDFITTNQRDQVLRQRKFLIDSSWSRKFAKYGDHPNRVSIDAVLSGCVPIGRTFGLVAKEDGTGEFFQDGENCVLIPPDATPKQFAEAVNDCMNMPEVARLRMAEAGLPVAELWRATRVAQAFIDLAYGRSAGVWSGTGVKDNAVYHDGSLAVEQFFGGVAQEAAE